MAKLDLNNVKDTLKFGKDKKQTLFIGIVIFLAIVIAYGYIFFKPHAGELMALFSKLSDLKLQLSSAKTDIATKPMLEKTKASLLSKIDYYEKKLPEQKEIPKILESLSEIAIDAGVKIIAIKPAESSMGGGIYQEMPIQIKAKCGYHQLGIFINSLETGDRFMKVSDINVVANAEDMLNHNVELEIKTYTLSKEK